MRQLSSELEDRTLRFDGVSILEPEKIAKAIIRGVPPTAIRVRGSSPEIDLYNAQVAEPDRILPEADEPISLDMTWRLPEKYMNLDLWETIADSFTERSRTLEYDAQTEEEALYRLEAEFEEINRRGMVEFMRTVIYVLDTFREKGVVWGVGRGSSCASYVLFILGLHAVDCVKYKVPMEEFFHD
jgi:DNA polymerase III alpha subunit